MKKEEFWDKKTIKYCDRKLEKLNDEVLSCLEKKGISTLSKEHFFPGKESNETHNPYNPYPMRQITPHKYCLKVTPKEGITVLDIESLEKLSQQFCSALKRSNYLNSFPRIGLWDRNKPH